MQQRLSYNLAVYIANNINRHSAKEGLEFTKMIFGVESFLITISKLIVVYTLAILLGTMVQTLIIQISFSLLRRHSFGLHALKSTICTVVSCCLFVLVPWLLSGAGVGNIVVIALYIPMMFCFYIYAPADTKARPLVGKELRAQLKNRTLMCVVALMVATLLIPSQSVKLLLTIGAVYQCISILPLTYKILRRSEKNYEQYEDV